MIDFKGEISKIISNSVELDEEEIMKSIEIPKDKKQGDYAFPCFRLAKVLKKSPQIIAEELASNLKFEADLIEKTEVIGGYINFFVNKKQLAKTVCNEVREKQKEYGKSDFGKRKNNSYRLFFS